MTAGSNRTPSWGTIGVWRGSWLARVVGLRSIGSPGRGFSFRSAQRVHALLVYLLIFSISPLPGWAALVVDPPMPITHQVTVQLIQTGTTEETEWATVFGNETQRATIEEKVDRIWAQAGVDIEFLPMVTPYASTFAFQGNSSPRPNSDLTSILSQAALAGGILSEDPTVVNMFLVDVVPGFSFTNENTANGLARIGSSGIAQFVGDNLLGFGLGTDTIAKVVAHEIGHNLGLQHTAAGAANLMAGSGGTTQQLSTQQIGAIFQRTFRNDSVAFIPSGGTGFVVPLPPPPERTWDNSSGGSWNLDNNWEPNTAPNGSGDIAILGDVITGDRSITVSSQVDLSGLVFDNGVYAYRLQGGGSINSVSDATASVNVLNGSHVMNVDWYVEAPTSLGISTGSELQLDQEWFLSGQEVVLSGGGVLNVAGTTSFGIGTLSAIDGTVQGDGQIAADLQNPSGVISPGEATGRLSVNGDFEQGASGGLLIELGGLAAGLSYDQLSVSGTADLGGTLSVDLLPIGAGTFAPQLGYEFEILSASGGITGTFDLSGSTLPVLGGNLDWDVEYGATSVTLAVVEGGVLVGDYNGDGVVSVSDYLVWRDSLGSVTNLSADGNGDGLVNAGDYDVWKSVFVANGSSSGSGGGSGSSFAALSEQVPEPSTAILWLLVAMLGLGAGFRHRKRSAT